MKVKWTTLIADLQGGFDQKHYARHIPGNGEWAAVCNKPELSKKTKKKKASHQTVKNFSNYIAISTEILRDPARRAIWQARYTEAVKKAKRHNKHIQGRLVDYVRHEVNEALKRGEEIA